ncbi:MAG: aminopeptidase P family protein [Bacteroidales bacterium]|nr:aminopeptidase P family protein [Bacteroidales bacterium]
MFKKEIYIKRRKNLREKMSSGLLLFLGNQDVAFNYPANIYPFRQDSSFVYFFGIDQPGLAAVIDVESGEEIIFGNELTIDDIIWMGKLPTIKDLSEKVGISNVLPSSELSVILSTAIKLNRKIHYLPPYRGEIKHQIENLIGIKYDLTRDYASIELIKAVVSLRSIKDALEVAEIEKMVDVAYKMHTTAMKLAKPGVKEQQITGAITGVTWEHEGFLSFPAIVTVNGQTLHNNYYGNTLKEGQLLVCDSGAEAYSKYCSDITRTTPVGGKFNERQKEIYEIVLKANLAVIDNVKPDIFYKDMHILSAKTIAQGLKDVGIIKGNVDDAVAAGAHALFYPHGLGHMLGLDVHDMEGFGENYVGYDKEIQRATQFGLAFLRLGRRLKPGFVITVEPGIYFIPELIDIWKSENKLSEFINYDKVETYKDFGGIRIEDDILITETGARVLGKPIPKTVADVEKMCAE